MGYRRPDGKAGTRNYLTLIGTVNCSASAIRAIQRRFGPELLRAYPQIDGIIGLTHKNGCAMGCETNQIHELIRARELDHGERWKESLYFNLQENRGIAQMVGEGVCLIGELLPKVNGIRRESLPLSGLTLALQCGGGEGWSGVTANPALGYCADELVRQGGNRDP